MRNPDAPISGSDLIPPRRAEQRQSQDLPFDASYLSQEINELIIVRTTFLRPAFPMSARIIKTARILKSNLLVTFSAARLLAALGATRGNHLFFPSYLCWRGIFITDSMPSWSVLLNLCRSSPIQRSGTKLLFPTTLRTTKISILSDSFKYNPQDIVSYPFTDFSAFHAN